MQLSRTAFDDPINRAAAGFYTAPQAEGATLPGGLTLSLIHCSEIDDALRVEWRALGEAASNPNPYFAQWFLEPTMRYLDPSEEVKLVLLRRAETGLLVGLAPFVFQKGYAKLPLKHVCVWTHNHCFNGAPLIREGFSVAVYSALFDWVDTRPDGSLFIRFSMLPFDGEAHGALDEACALRDRSFRIQEYHDCAAKYLASVGAEDSQEKGLLLQFASNLDAFEASDDAMLLRMIDGPCFEHPPIAQINVPAKRVTDKTLLGTAAALEKFKNKALKRLPRKR